MLVLESTGVTICNTRTGCPILLQEYPLCKARARYCCKLFLECAPRHAWAMYFRKGWENALSQFCGGSERCLSKEAIFHRERIFALAYVTIFL